MKNIIVLITLCLSLSNLYSQDKLPELVGGLDSLQKLIVNPDDNKVQGKVELLIFLNEKGIIDSIRVMKTIGNEFEEEAIDKIRTMKFIPAFNYAINESIKSQMLIPVIFPPEKYFCD